MSASTDATSQLSDDGWRAALGIGSALDSSSPPVWHGASIRSVRELGVQIVFHRSIADGTEEEEVEWIARETVIDWL
jgi:hypothetical protein